MALLLPLLKLKVLKEEVPGFIAFVLCYLFNLKLNLGEAVLMVLPPDLGI